MRQILIENAAKVKESLIDQILSVAAPTRGDHLIVLGDDDLGGPYVGLCVPRFVLLEARTPAAMVRGSQTWDCAVVLPNKTCAFSTTHVGFFVQVLAHELGHSHVAIDQPDLHIYCSFIDRHICELSNGAVTRWHELPHERAHDAFGIAIAERVVGRECLESDWSRLLRDESRKDHDRIRFVRRLAPRTSLDTLRSEVSAFARPYAAALCARWTDLLETSHQAGGSHLTQLAPHIDALFS